MALQRYFAVCIVVVGFLAAAVSPAEADPPLVLRNYRVLPEVSTLHQTGGFAAVDDRWSISGTFGLVTGYESDFHNLTPFAQFVDVNAVSHHPVHDFPWPLDDALNLTGLAGTFDPTHPNLLHFTGLDGQGAPIRVQGAIQGRRVHLTGRNDPLPGQADFFAYELNAFAVLTPLADFDGDHDVDGDDFLVWQSHLGALFITPGGPGDADFDGDVDGDDFLIWQREFQSDIGGPAAIPEPTMVTLFATGLLALSIQLRTRRA